MNQEQFNMQSNSIYSVLRSRLGWQVVLSSQNQEDILFFLMAIPYIFISEPSFHFPSDNLSFIGNYLHVVFNLISYFNAFITKTVM